MNSDTTSIGSRKRVIYNGFKYQLNKVSKGKKYYRCSKFQSFRCRATLISTHEGIIQKGSHKCSKNSVQPSNNDSNHASTEEYIESFLDNHCQSLELFPFQIY
ncbi:hypothetical protein RF11_07283 [Thelohanellus kitauei]|uniref:FLYWCH-type domain-containing protein n=1 Tax=Thelohanellus kitauei TaxID=669202 RepID=A0A0C2MR36_THEKT|nr:hypothetical protein RF11_07283 [Thelohanellus kitauei]